MTFTYIYDNIDTEREVITMNYIEYKGYYIETNFYGQNEISVQYCGDDILFPTVQEAKEFIDEVVKEV